MDLIRILGGVLLLPLPVSLLFLLVGSALLWLRRRKRLARGLVTAGTLLLLAASTATVPRAALGSLEDDFEPYAADARPPAEPPAGVAAPDAGDLVPRPAPTAAPAPEWVVVLCGGGGDAPGWPDLAGLSAHTLARVTEGVRIARLHPEARVLFTGGAVEGARPCSDVMRGAAVELGFDPTRIERDTTSRTTEHEAEAVERIVGRAPFVLVTAASHLPRAVALMEARGLRPLPAPAAPRTAGPGPGLLGRLLPSSETLVGSAMWTHEVVGRLWSSVRGRI